MAQVELDDGLMKVRASAPAIRQFVTLILCPNQEFLELRFIDTAFAAEPASEVRLFLAEHRGALPQLPNVVARHVGLPQHRRRSTRRCYGGGAACGRCRRDSC